MFYFFILPLPRISYFFYPSALFSFIHFSVFSYQPIGLHLLNYLLSEIFLLPVHWTIPSLFYYYSSSSLLFHWTVPPFLFSLCLCFHYITFFLIVNTFFKNILNFFILSVLPYLFLNFQKIQTVFQSFPEYLPYPAIIRNPPASYVPAHTQKAFSCHPENFILY